MSLTLYVAHALVFNLVVDWLGWVEPDRPRHGADVRRRATGSSPSPPPLVAPARSASARPSGSTAGSAAEACRPRSVSRWRCDRSRPRAHRHPGAPRPPAEGDDALRGAPRPPQRCRHRVRRRRDRPPSASVSSPRFAAGATKRRRRARRTPRGGCSTPTTSTRTCRGQARWCQCVGASARPSRDPRCSSSGVSAARRPATSRPSSPASTRRRGEPSTSPPSPPSLADRIGAAADADRGRRARARPIVDVPTVGPRARTSPPACRRRAGCSTRCRPGARPMGCSASSTRRPSSSSAPEIGGGVAGRLVRRAPCPVLVVPAGLQHLGERVALLRVAGLEAAPEPRHPLLGRPVGEALRVDRPCRPAAGCGRRRRPRRR